MSGSRRSSTTQSKRLARSAASASSPVPDGRDLDVVVRDQLDDRELLGRVVLDDEQPPRARRREPLDAVEGGLEPLGGERLVEVRERAALEAVLPLLLDGDDLHRDVPRRGVLLELARAPSSPACRAGRCRARSRWAGACGASSSASAPRMRDQTLEAALAREPQEHARVVRVVLDDQQHLVAGLAGPRDRPAPPRRAARAARPAGTAARASARGRAPAALPNAGPA